MSLGKLLTYTRMPLSPSSITPYRSKGGDTLRLGRWRCRTHWPMALCQRLCGLSTYGLKREMTLMTLCLSYCLLLLLLLQTICCLIDGARIWPKPCSPMVRYVFRFVSMTSFRSETSSRWWYRDGGGGMYTSTLIRPCRGDRRDLTNLDGRGV